MINPTSLTIPTDAPCFVFAKNLADLGRLTIGENYVNETRIEMTPLVVTLETPRSLEPTSRQIEKVKFSDHILLIGPIESCLPLAKALSFLGTKQLKKIIPVVILTTDNVEQNVLKKLQKLPEVYIMQVHSFLSLLSSVEESCI